MKITLIVLGSIALVLCAFMSALLMLPLVHSVQAAEIKTAQRKLVGTSWHCSGNYPCELWYLTRPARPGEAAEKIGLVTIDGEDKLVFDETVETKTKTWRVSTGLPKGLKLTGVGWKCYGQGQCRAFLQTRPMRKDETAESYLFDNGTEHYSIKETP